MKTYKETELDFIVEFDGDKQTGIKKGIIRTRIVDGEPILNEEGEETGSFEQITEEYNPWQDLIDSGVEVEWIDRDALNKESQRLALTQVRENALKQITHTVDGHVVQVRPKDLGNFNLVIAMGQSTQWILEDNTLALLTIEQLQECMNSGIAQGQAIWAQFFTDYEAIL